MAGTVLAPEGRALVTCLHRRGLGLQTRSSPGSDKSVNEALECTEFGCAALRAQQGVTRDT